MKIVAHVLLFVVAILLYFLGLGVGLAFNPILGALLWLLAAAIAVANVLWIVRTKK